MAKTKPPAARRKPAKPPKLDRSVSESAGRERWTVRIRGDLVGRVNRAALYGYPRVTVSEIIEAALEAELVRREKSIPADVPLVGRGEIPRGRIPLVEREGRS